METLVVNSLWRVRARRCNQGLRRWFWGLSLTRSHREKLWREVQRYSLAGDITNLARVQQKLGNGCLYRYSEAERVAQRALAERVIQSLV